MKKVILNYSFCRPKGSRKTSVGFVVYAYDTETESKKYPSLNDTKYTDKGLLKSSDISSLKKHDIEQCDPFKVAFGFFPPKIGPFGIVQCQFLSEIQDYLKTFCPEAEIKVLVESPVLLKIMNNEHVELSEDIVSKVKSELTNFNTDGKIILTKSLVQNQALFLAQWASCLDLKELKTLEYDEPPKFKADDPHPWLLNSSLCYFYNKEVPDENKGYHQYLVSKFSKTDKFPEDGKPMSGYGLGIVRLEKEEPILERAMDLHRKSFVSKRLGMNAVINLPALFNKKFLEYFMNFDTPPILSKRDSELNPVITYKSSGETLVSDTYRVIRKLDGEKKMTEMTELLDQIVAGDKSKHEAIDITDLIYIKNEEKGKLEIDKTLNGKKVIDVPKELVKKYTTRKLKLKCGYDIPIYRCLNKTKEINTKVLLILYDKTKTPNGERFERYCVFIRSGNEVSLWSSVYSNNLFSFLVK